MWTWTAATDRGAPSDARDPRPGRHRARLDRQRPRLRPRPRAGRREAARGRELHRRPAATALRVIATAASAHRSRRRARRPPVEGYRDFIVLAPYQHLWFPTRMTGPGRSEGVARTDLHHDRRMTSDGWADAGGEVIALDEHAAWCLAARESRNPLWHALVVGTTFEKLVAAVTESTTRRPTTRQRRRSSAGDARRPRAPRPLAGRGPRQGLDLLAVALTIHEPPTQTTFGCARYSGALARLIPPVGQKRICGNGPANAFSAATPPTTSAGNSFAWVMPRSSSATMSDAVAVPGRNGTPLAWRPSSSVGVAPGETRKRAPSSERLGDLAVRGDRAGADDGVRDLGRDPLDRRRRGGGAQRDLDHRQAAADERLGERDGVLDVVDHDDGDDGREAGEFFDAERHA